MSDKKNIYLYPHSLLQAKRLGELELYQASFKENVRCAKAIEKSIRENFDGMYLNANIVPLLVDEFGYDRVSFVLANTLQELSYDGRFSRANKEWAKGFSIPDTKGNNRNFEFQVTSHPAVLDGFITMYRRELENAQSVECNNISPVSGQSM